MSKISTLFGAAALLVSVSAFAQTTTTTPPADNGASTAPAPIASSDSSGDMGHAKIHHKHHAQAVRNNSTDKDADKLNACMAYATPTSSQEQCLQKASQS